MSNPKSPTHVKFDDTLSQADSIHAELSHDKPAASAMSDMMRRPSMSRTKSITPSVPVAPSTPAIATSSSAATPLVTPTSSLTQAVALAKNMKKMASTPLASTQSSSGYVPRSALFAAAKAVGLGSGSAPINDAELHERMRRAGMTIPDNKALTVSVADPVRMKSPPRDRAMSPHRLTRSVSIMGALTDDRPVPNTDGMSTDELVRAKQFEFALQLEKKDRQMRAQIAREAAEQERTARMLEAHNAHAAGQQERKFLQKVSNDAFEAERKRKIESLLVGVEDEQHQAHYEYIMSLQANEQARRESMSIRHAVPAQVEEENELREESLDITHDAEHDEALLRFMQFGEHHDYFDAMEAERMPGVQAAVDGAELERVRREHEEALDRELARHQQTVRAMHADQASGQEAVQQMLDHARQAEENRWRRERESARAGVAAAMEQVRQTALWLGYGDSMPEDVDLPGLSKMYPQLVDLSNDPQTASVVAASDWTASQPQSKKSSTHSLSVPELRETPVVFMQMILHETPRNVQAEICDALSMQQAHQRQWQLAHVRRLRRLLEQQTEFEHHMHEISVAKRAEQERLETERAHRARVTAEFERREAEAAVARAHAERVAIKNADYQRRVAEEEARHQAWLRIRKLPDQIAQEKQEYERNMALYRAQSEALLTEARRRVADPRSGTLLKRGKMGIAYNPRYITLRVQSFAPTANSASTPGLIKLARSDSSNGDSSLTVPTEWSGVVEALAWDSEAESQRLPDKPKYRWTLRGLRASAAAVDAVCKDSAGVLAAAAAAGPSAALTDTTSPQHSITVLCADGEQVLACATSVEARSWMLTIARLLTAANDAAQAVALFALPKNMPAVPVAPQPQVDFVPRHIAPPSPEIAPRVASPIARPMSPMPAFSLPNQPSEQLNLADFPSIDELRVLETDLVTAAPKAFASFRPAVIELALFVYLEQGEGEQPLCTRLPSITIFPDLTPSWRGLDSREHDLEASKAGLPIMHSHDAATLQALQDEVDWLTLEEKEADAQRDHQLAVAAQVARQRAEDEYREQVERREAALAELERARQAEEERAAQLELERQQKIIAMRRSFNHEEFYDAMLAANVTMDPAHMPDHMPPPIAMSTAPVPHSPSSQSLLAQSFADLMHSTSGPVAMRAQSSGGIAGAVDARAAKLSKSPTPIDTAAAALAAAQRLTGSAPSSPQPVAPASPSPTSPANRSTSPQNLLTTGVMFTATSTQSVTVGAAAITTTTTTMTTTTTSIDLLPEPQLRLPNEDDVRQVLLELFPPRPPAVDLVQSMYESAAHGLSLSTLCSPAPFSMLLHTWRTYAQAAFVHTASSFQALKRDGYFVADLQTMTAAAAAVSLRVHSLGPLFHVATALGSAFPYLTVFAAECRAPTFAPLTSDPLVHFLASGAAQATADRAAAAAFSTTSDMYVAADDQSTAVTARSSSITGPSRGGPPKLNRGLSTRRVSAYTPMSARINSSRLSAGASARSAFEAHLDSQMSTIGAGLAAIEDATELANMHHTAFVPIWLAYLLPTGASDRALSRFEARVAFGRMLTRGRTHRWVRTARGRQLLSSGYYWPSQMEPDFMLAGLPDGSSNDAWDAFESPESLAQQAQSQQDPDHYEQIARAPALNRGLSLYIGEEEQEESADLPDQSGLMSPTAALVVGLETARDRAVSERQELAAARHARANPWWDCAAEEEASVAELILQPTRQVQREADAAWVRHKKRRSIGAISERERLRRLADQSGTKAHPLYSTLKVDVRAFGSSAAALAAFEEQHLGITHHDSGSDSEDDAEARAAREEQERVERELEKLVSLQSEHSQQYRLAQHASPMAVAGSFAFAAFRRSIHKFLGDSQLIGQAFDALMNPGVLPVLLAHRRRANVLGGRLAEIARLEFADECARALWETRTARQASVALARSILAQEQMLRADSFTEQVLVLRARPNFVDEWWFNYENSDSAENAERQRRVRAHLVEIELSRSERAARTMFARLAATREQLLRSVRMWEWSYTGVAHADTAAAVYDQAAAEADQAEKISEQLTRGSIDAGELSLNTPISSPTNRAMSPSRRRKSQTPSRSQSLSIAAPVREFSDQHAVSAWQHALLEVQTARTDAEVLVSSRAQLKRKHVVEVASAAAGSPITQPDDAALIESLDAHDVAFEALASICQYYASAAAELESLPALQGMLPSTAFVDPVSAMDSVAQSFLNAWEQRKSTRHSRLAELCAGIERWTLACRQAHTRGVRALVCTSSLDFPRLQFVPPAVKGAAGVASSATVVQVMTSPRTNGALPSETSGSASPRTASLIVSSVLSADDADESSNSIDPLSVAPTEEASPADVASHWCVALDALAWCWRQTATQQLPAELEAVAMELCELTRQDAFAHLSSWRSIHSVAGLQTRKLVEQSAQVDRVTPLSQSLLPGGAHAWALYSPFAPSTDDWTSTAPKSDRDSSGALSVHNWPASHLVTASVVNAGEGAFLAPGVQWSSHCLQNAASANMNSDALMTLAAAAPALGPMLAMVPAHRSNDAVIASHAPAAQPDSLATTVLSSWRAPHPQVAHLQAQIAALHNFYRARRQTRAPQLYTIPEQVSSAEDVHNSALDALRAQLMHALDTARSLGTHLESSELLVRRAINAWVSRQLQEEERSSIRNVAQFAAHEAAIERAARTQLAILLQDSVRQADFAHRAAVAANMRLERLQAKAMAVAAEEKEREERIALHLQAIEHTLQLRKEAHEQSLSAHAEHLNELAAERDQLVSDAALERADDKEAALQLEVVGREERVSVERQATVTTLMHLHQGQVEARAAQQCALDEVAAAWKAARLEGREYSLLHQQRTRAEQEIERQSVAEERRQVHEAMQQVRKEMLQQTAQLQAIAVQQDHVEPRAEVAVEFAAEKAQRVDAAIQLASIASAEHRYEYLVGQSADDSERKRRRQIATKLIQDEQISRVEDDVQNVRDEARERQLRRDASVATWASEFAAAAAEFAHSYAYSGQCAERAEQRAATKASVLQAVAAEREMQVGWHRAASQASADAYRERKAIATETWDRELAERQATRQQVLNAAARASDAARADAVLSAHILAERERQRRMTIDAAFVAGDKKARASWAPYVRVAMERERARRLAQTSGVCEPSFLDASATVLQYIIASTQPDALVRLQSEVQSAPAPSSLMSSAPLARPGSALHAITNLSTPRSAYLGNTVLSYASTMVQSRSPLSTPRFTVPATPSAKAMPANPTPFDAPMLSELSAYLISMVPNAAAAGPTSGEHALASIFFATLSLISALMSLPSLPSAVQRHLQTFSVARDGVLAEPFIDYLWATEAPAYHRELAAFVASWFGPEVLNDTEAQAQAQPTDTRSTHATAAPPAHIRELMLRLLAVSVPATDNGQELFPAPAWIRAALSAGTIPVGWHTAVEFAAPIQLDGGSFQPVGEETSPASLYCASSASIYKYFFDPKFVESPPLTAVEPMSFPSASSGYSLDMQAARGLRALLFASFECLVHVTSTTESASMLRRVSAEFGRFGDLCASFERRLQTVAAFSGRQGELERLRIADIENAQYEIDERVRRVNMAVQQRVVEQHLFEAEQKLEVSLALQLRAAEKKAALIAEESERKRRLLEVRAAALESLKAREQAYEEATVAYAQWQGRLVHAHEAARVASRLERREAIRIAKAAAQAELDARLQAHREAHVASRRDRGRNAHMARLAEAATKAEFMSGRASMMHDIFSDRIRAQREVYARTEEERKRRIVASYGSSAVVSAAREVANAGIVLGVDREASSAPLPPAFVPVSARRQSAMAEAEEKAAQEVAAAHAQEQALHTARSISGEESAAESVADLARIQALMQAQHIDAHHTAPILAPSTAKIVAASSTLPPIEEFTASVWADMSMMSARGTGSGQISARETPRSQGVTVSAASTALISSLSSLSTYIQSLEQATKRLQRVRASVARVNAQALVDNERQRRAYEDALVAEQEMLERQHNRALAVVMMERERALRLHEFAATQEEEWEMRRGAQVSAVESMESERQRRVTVLRDKMRAERERRQRTRDQQRINALEVERNRHERVRALSSQPTELALNTSALTLNLSTAPTSPDTTFAQSPIYASNAQRTTPAALNTSWTPAVQTTSVSPTKIASTALPNDPQAAARLAAARVPPPALSLPSSTMTAEQQAAWRAQQVARARASASNLSTSSSTSMMSPAGVTPSSSQMSAQSRAALLAKARAAVPMSTSMSTAALPAWQQQYFQGPSSPTASPSAVETETVARVSMAKSGRSAAVTSAGNAGPAAAPRTSSTPTR